MVEELRPIAMGTQKKARKNVARTAGACLELRPFGGQ
jgi:hypothetical protein